MSRVTSKVKILPRVLCQRSPVTSSTSRTLVTSASQNAWFFSKDKQAGAGYSQSLAKTKDPNVYKLITDSVIPSRWDEYLACKAKMVEYTEAESTNKSNLVASWSIVTGDEVFKAIHLYKYPEGWTGIDSTHQAMKQDAEYQALAKSMLPTIRSKNIEFEKSFAFWPAPNIRTGNNVYDIRTYALKPGSMYDWSNFWAKGIECRAAVRPDIPYAGFFPQLGQLHFIYHIWCYPSMADRKACREDTWNQPEWSNIVARTVPLVNAMSTRIMEPLPFSPTQ